MIVMLLPDVTGESAIHMYTAYQKNLSPKRNVITISISANMSVEDSIDPAYNTITITSSVIRRPFARDVITIASGIEPSFSAGDIVTTDTLEESLLQKKNTKVSELVYSLEIEPIEVGCFHPAEYLMEDILKFSRSNFYDVISSAYIENANTRPAIAAGMLRCLGRLRRDLVLPWSLFIALNGLFHMNIEIREAAVRALERWGSHEAIDALKRCVDTEPVAWLAAYIKQVLVDLAD